MGRPKNPKALTPAQRKAESRERKKATGSVRLQTEVEVYTAIVIERAAVLLKTTASKVVADLVAACRNKETPLKETIDGVVLDFGRDADGVDAGEPYIRHVAREVLARQVDLDLPADVHAWLTTREGMSASSVIETVVNMRCFLVPEEFIGASDTEGTEFTASDFDYRRLVYTHPGDTAWLRTDMCALTPEDVKWRYCSEKYDRRRNAVLDHAHANANANARHTGVNADPYGDAYISRLVDGMNRRAMSTHIDATWERYYDAAPQKGHNAPGDDEAP